MGISIKLSKQCKIMKIGRKIKSSPSISDIHTIVSDIVNDCTGGYLWTYTYRFTYGSVDTSIESI